MFSGATVFKQTFLDKNTPSKSDFAHFKPDTKPKLQDAVNQWCDASDSNTDKYNGVPINFWYTS